MRTRGYHARFVRAGFGGCIALFLCIALSPASSHGQDLRVRRVASNRLRAPSVSAPGASEPRAPGAPKQWAQIECQFETRPEWMDELEFTYYVLLQSGDPRQPYVLLTEKISYLNVPRGRPHFSWLYIHPHVLDRIGAVDGVAVEVRAGGEMVAAEASSPQHLQQYRQWVAQLTPRSGLLLKPENTPFSLFAPDLQHMIKRP